MVQMAGIVIVKDTPNYIKIGNFIHFLFKISLFINNKLIEHLLEIDKTANERFEFLMKQLAKKENITEELKATDQLKWVGLMNNIKNSVNEIILKELIYV